MVVEYIQYDLAPDDWSRFHEAYEQAGPYLSASPHCISWEVTQGVEEPGRHTVRIVWDSQEGHEVGFRGSEDFKSFFALLTPFAGGRREMAHFAEVDGGIGAHR